MFGRKRAKEALDVWNRLTLDSGALESIFVAVEAAVNSASNVSFTIAGVDMKGSRESISVRYKNLSHHGLHFAGEVAKKYESTYAAKIEISGRYYVSGMRARGDFKSYLDAALWTGNRLVVIGAVELTLTRRR